MKLSIAIFTFILWNTLSFSQTNDYNVYQEAISVIKKNSNYTKYLEDYQYKDKISVADGLYPICAFCKTFSDEITCCKPVENISDLFSGLEKKGLKSLGNANKSKITFYFTIIENEYFVGEVISDKKSNKTLSYLFKTENEKIKLIKVVENN
ncbi:hypothetical protein [Flavobacterium caeni]|nr:hypothetical protein [Flavobacterium caeni]